MRLHEAFEKSILVQQASGDPKRAYDKDGKVYTLDEHLGSWKSGREKGFAVITMPQAIATDWKPAKGELYGM